MRLALGLDVAHLIEGDLQAFEHAARRAPPWKVFETNAPPGFSLSMAKLAAASIRPTIFRWSVRRWPTVLWAISLSTKSGGAPSVAISRSHRAGFGKVAQH